jgi:transposase
MEADMPIADKAFDANERVIALLADQNKAAVIRPKANRKVARTYDRELYKARHLIENFFAKLSSSAPSPPVTTKPPETSSRPSMSPPAPSGLIDHRHLV